MTEFRKYQHVENKIGSKTTNGLFNGEVTIQPKIDGSNCQMYLDGNQLVIASRTRKLSLESDNANCYNTLSRDERFKRFFADNPNFKLCGEWLVSHKIKYQDGAYNKFYVFDAILLDTETEDGVCEYVPYQLLVELLASYGIEYVPYINLQDITHKEITDTIFTSYVDFVNFLIEPSEVARCEGVVIKNYNYTNSFGRKTWLKLINEEFYKISGHQKPRLPVDKTKELDYVDENLSNHLLSKQLHKLGEFDRKLTGSYVQSCQTEFLEDFVSKHGEVLNIKAINNIIAARAVQYLKDIGVM